MNTNAITYIYIYDYDIMCIYMTIYIYIIELYIRNSQGLFGEFFMTPPSLSQHFRLQVEALRLTPNFPGKRYLRRNRP